MAFLLLVLQMGNPVPLFAIPMPDDRACAINAVAMTQILNEDAKAGCFDVASQMFHAIPRPTTHGEKIE